MIRVEAGALKGGESVYGRFQGTRAHAVLLAGASLLVGKNLRRRVAGPAAAVLLASVVTVTLPTASAAPASCANPIVCENQLPGTPQSAWDVSYGEGTTIQGFADPFSVNVGGSINFKIKSSASSYKIDIYRMGYYGGDGARLITSLTPNISVSQSQPACNTNTTTGLVDCGNWGVSATWNVPTTVVSGVYFAHIDSSTDENQIPFVVTNNASTSNVVFMTSDETWQAYNDWGGYSVYKGSATGKPWCCTTLDPGRAVQVSYNRPFATRFDTANGQDFFFYAEFPTIQFLEQNGYDVTYVSQPDVAASGAATMLKQHKALVMAGHSEYFDAGDRANITAARDAGVSLAFFSGNLMWWKTRFANSQYGNEPYRTLITYKESLDSVQSDPADPPTWTGAWRDPRFSPPADGQPENSLTGQLWLVNCCSYADQVPYAYSKLQIWRNTAVANLQPGQTYTMPGETLGYEWDSDVDNGSRPPGEIDMSKTCENVSQLLLTVTENIGSGNACNSLTLYRAASGALVFDAGTVQWAWGLNANHDGDSHNPADATMQQATVNLLAMMGVQPATLMSGLVAGSAPSASAPPSSTITSPSAGATFANGTTATVSGTATDTGGGVVAGVEVSTNGGATWHPATTMSPAGTSVTWSYTWPVAGLGTETIMSRASDDAGNTEQPGLGVSVTVNCPCGLFANNYVPSTTSTNDPAAYELGMKFQSSVAGWVAGVRFYKGTGNNGTHTGSLWTASGTLLATGTFTNETASGWQTLLFANPVQISANTIYVASYYDPDGNYASDLDLFDTQLNTPPLSAPKTNYMSTGGGTGVFYAGGPNFPTSTFQGTSYGVDVIFDTTQPPGAHPAVTSVTPYPGSSSNAVATAPTATFSKPVVPSTASFTLTDPGGNTVSGTTTFDSTDTVATFTPASALAAATTYKVTISGAQDSFGQAMTPYTYSFTTSRQATGDCPCTIWPDVAPQGAADAADASSVELGVEFQAAAAGTITGIRFYKEPDNTGTHTGSLWTSSGTLLASGTFSNESTEGWEELDFSTPVSITAGTTYVASYHTSTGHYADTSGGLASAVTNGPLTALANGGVYAYGSAGTFPSSSYGKSNYWVEPLYSDPNPPTVTTTAPSSSATSVPVTSSVTATFSKSVRTGSATFTLTDPHGNAVPGTASLNSAGTVLTFTPSSQLAQATVYQASVSGATSVSGVAMTAPATWSFTTSGACPCTIFESDAAPTTASVSDSSSVELGVKFTPAVSGWVSGVRFYKGPGNTGTHTGSLWTDTGTLLAHGTFTGETASGWQTLEFPTAVQVNSGQTYVASYYAPNGGYADSPGYFSASGYSNPPLNALKDGSDGGNGIYAYGGDQFPASSYGSANYWVDPIFWTSPPPDFVAPAVSATNPPNGQTNVAMDSAVAFTFNKQVQAGTIQFTMTGPGGTSVPGTLSYNSSTDTATFTPSGALVGGSGPLAGNTSYTATVSAATDSAGTPMASPYSWSFTTRAANQCPCTIWPSSAQPATPTANDTSAINVGVKFTTTENGRITGIRFYKGAGNSGTHVGSLWDASGNLLGQVTFTNESASGWQEADFSTPIQVTAGTTYVASYFAPNGGYSVTPAQFANAGVDNQPLEVPASSAVSGGNGVYLYASASQFPTNTYNATNYWVDVVFTAP
jgi:methionine-rich copper-binding protein CopC